MSNAIYPGSFDPITTGHLDIIKRASKIFDAVTVVISNNPNKTNYCFSLLDRIQFVKDCIAKEGLTNVRITCNESRLSVDIAKDEGASVIIRGVRNMTDFAYEQNMANVNLSQSSDIETMMMFAKSEYDAVSSSTVRELAKYPESNLKLYVPLPKIRTFSFRTRM